MLGGLSIGALAIGWLRHVLALDELIHSVAIEMGVEPRLVRAVAWRESRMRPRAVGGVGERGLMQVTETVGLKWAENHDLYAFAVDDLFDPETNIRAGTWYLARALDQWSDRSDPVPYALAQYNAGRSHALRWAREDGGDPLQFVAQITYPSTRAYIADIQQFAALPHPPWVTQIRAFPSGPNRLAQAAVWLLVLTHAVVGVRALRHSIPWAVAVLLIPFGLVACIILRPDLAKPAYPLLLMTLLLVIASVTLL